MNNPKLLGRFPIKVEEFLLYMYLPIKMANSGIVRIPEPLQIFRPLINQSVGNAENTEYNDWYESYIYLTVKNLYVTPDNLGNRPGWHIDGFLTDDKNWIWYNKNPTEINIGDFNLTPDHEISMREMEEQAKPENTITYPNNSLIELSNVVHRASHNIEEGMRCFVKISMSKHKYNLLGNSHNYLFDYKWEMHDRKKVRNCPIYKEYKNSDFVG